MNENTLKFAKQAKNYYYIETVKSDLLNCKRCEDVINTCITALQPIWHSTSSFVESCPVLDSVGVVELTSSLIMLMNTVYNEIYCNDEHFSLVRDHINNVYAQFESSYSLDVFEKSYEN